VKQHEAIVVIVQLAKVSKQLFALGIKAIPLQEFVYSNLPTQ
jgi:hypothetical protein